MKISQMHERLRTALLRRVQRGELTVSRLSKQTGLAKSHVSKFLNGKGQLSTQALDRVLEAQHLGAEDLVDFNNRAQTLADRSHIVPVISHASALFEPDIRPGGVRMWLPMPVEALSMPRLRRPTTRHSWRRFVAIRINGDDARSMDPLVHEGAIAVIDRHYNSMEACHPPRQNVYAVRDGVRVVLRYVDHIGNHLVIRPANVGFRTNLIEIAEGANAGEYVAGRVAFILNEV